MAHVLDVYIAKMPRVFMLCTVTLVKDRLTAPSDRHAQQPGYFSVWSSVRWESDWVRKDKVFARLARIAMPSCISKKTTKNTIFKVKKWSNYVAQHNWTTF